MFSPKGPPANGSILSMRFPKRLWKIVTECKTGAIHWGREGKSIVFDYKKFENEYLTSNMEYFKTCNITSFIRQLNFYGFRKVGRHSSNLKGLDIHEYCNENFVQGRLDLLQNVSRKTATLRPRQSDRVLHGTARSPRTRDVKSKRYQEPSTSTYQSRNQNAFLPSVSYVDMQNEATHDGTQNVSSNLYQFFYPFDEAYDFLPGCPVIPDEVMRLMDKNLTDTIYHYLYGNDESTEISSNSAE